MVKHIHFKPKLTLSTMATALSLSVLSSAANAGAPTGALTALGVAADLIAISDYVGLPDGDSESSATFGLAIVDQAATFGTLDVIDSTLLINQLDVDGAKVGALITSQNVDIGSATVRNGSTVTLNTGHLSGVRAGAVFIKQTFDAGRLSVDGGLVSANRLTARTVSRAN